MTGMPGKGSGARELKVRVKTGKGRKLSSKLWLDRQLNDPYVARAKREGMRSRAAYKLSEIDDKAHFLKKGSRVVDLGAAPGGWSQVAAKRVNAPKQGRVIATNRLNPYRKELTIPSSLRTFGPKKRSCIPKFYWQLTSVE